jgi:uncharacterized protein DUF3182
MSAFSPEVRMPGRNGAGCVVLFSEGLARREAHERIARSAIAARLANALGYDYAGEYDAALHAMRRLYFVPDDTLLTSTAARVGIRSDEDLFGGVVPYRFVATKAVTHPAIGATARVPDGWSHSLGERLASATLLGYSAFTLGDARLAAAHLFDAGRVRFKPAQISGGGGQAVVSSPVEAERALMHFDEAAVRAHGLVVEQNLEEATTHSVGQLRVADLLVSYHGIQRVTRNHRGHEVYGGSDLVVVRGSFDRLLRLDVHRDVRTVISKAIAYDAAISREYPTFFASRRNYDVACGHDRDGAPICGVLEQSWRFGGASAAEIAALEAFRADPALDIVRAATHEDYSADEPPPGAKVHFRGEDASVGFLTKYTTIERDGRPA